MGKIIFVRHGESKANATGKIATPSTRLSDEGIEQAIKTAKEVKKFGITKIACSPMLRAQQTAKAIANELGINTEDIIVVDELEERRFGTHEGKPKVRETEWYYMSDEEPSSEKTQDLINRMRRCLKKLTALANGEQLLVVGHGSSGFYLMQVAKGNIKIEDFDPPSQLPNADFVEIKISQS